MLDFQADVLALKFAQDLSGVDFKVVDRLIKKGTNVDARLPPIGASLLISSQHVVAAPEILFVGVEPLGKFDYGTIRNFSERVFSVLAEQRPGIQHVAMTLHGRGFGLDEAEAFRAEIAGLLDAVDRRRVPRELRQVSIVERERGAAERMRALLDTLIPQGSAIDKPKSDESESRVLGNARSELESVGRDSRTKPLVFVAMPFADE